MSKIPLSKCFVNAEVEEAALRAIRSGQYILGKESKAFEAELAAHTGTAQCVLGSSWTMIVYFLHQLQGVGPGDEIIVPSHTAFPSMEPLIHLGAKPVFADIDDTFVMDLAHVESLITPRTVGIIGVHLYGHPIDNDRLLAIAGSIIFGSSRIARRRRARNTRAKPSAAWAISARSAFSRRKISPCWATAAASPRTRPITPTACGCCAITAARANTTTNSPATTCASTKSTPPSAG